jgi:hypothetical protein
MNYIKPHQQRIINALYKNSEQRALVRDIFQHALSFANADAHVYNGQYTVQQLQQWHQQIQSIASHDDSVLNADIIDHYKIAAEYIIKLMNTM